MANLLESAMPCLINSFVIPIISFTSYLLQKKLVSTKEIEIIKNQIELEINNSFQTAQNAPFPDAESFKFDVYAK